MKLIDISTPKFPNTFAQVDDEDFDFLNQWKWFAFNNGKSKGIYAIRNEMVLSPRRISIFMHRVIIKTEQGMDTDHIDGNGLNNQKENLRSCTRHQNTMNRKMSNNKTGFKGVTPRGKRFIAQINANGTKYHIGVFDSSYSASLAYDSQALKYFGKFAKTNHKLGNAA